MRPVDDYPGRWLEMLQGLAPAARPSPTVVVLTPGMYNSAYFEHAFLARQMGVELPVAMRGMRQAASIPPNRKNNWPRPPLTVNPRSTGCWPRRSDCCRLQS